MHDNLGMYNFKLVKSIAIIEFPSHINNVVGVAST